MSVLTTPIPDILSRTNSPLGAVEAVAQISSPGAATHRMTPPKVLRARFAKCWVEAIVGPVVAATYPSLVEARDRGLAAAGTWLVGVAPFVESRRNAILLTVLAVASPPMNSSTTLRVDVVSVLTA